MFVTISDSNRATTKEGISFVSVLILKLFDSNTNSLFVMYANATANAQAIVFAIISLQ